MSPVTALIPSVPTFHVVLMVPTAVSADTSMAAWMGDFARMRPAASGAYTRVGIPGAT